MGFVVDELFACIATDEDGDEGVMAAQLGDTWLPLVAADLIRIQQYIPVANATGVDYKIKHFQLLGDISEEYIRQFKEAEEPEKKDDDTTSGNGKKRRHNGGGSVDD